MKTRNTPSKKIILELLKKADSALSQDNLQAEVSGEMDRVTIYRILNRFCEDGIIHKILADDGKSYYALCNGCTDESHDHNHFHFKCVECNKIQCLDEKLVINLPENYKMKSISGWITGVCASCPSV